MRALCGAIITAGALIGLGLFSLGEGLRYADYPYRDANGKSQFVYFRDMDTALLTSFVVLLAALVIGLGVAFLGLAYHHHRRHLELLRDHQRHTAATGTSPPGTTTTTEQRVSV
jgi:putative Mn2+ efflux pump MntP